VRASRSAGEAVAQLPPLLEALLTTEVKLQLQPSTLRPPCASAQLADATG
jgi:hypothetical protein